MKNIQGTTENLSLYSKNGGLIYEFKSGILSYTKHLKYESIYDHFNKCIKYKSSKGFGWEKTFDKNGNLLSYIDSEGCRRDYTYDSFNNKIHGIDEVGFTWKKTYDQDGNELTYEDSDGERRGFDIPEYTMEQLVAKIGNFKIKK